MVFGIKPIWAVGKDKFVPRNLGRELLKQWFIKEEGIMKLVIVRLFSLFFVLQVISPPVFAAQLILQAPDIEPPSIVFEVNATDLPEGLNSFEALVTDNVGVSSVTFFYRNAGGVAFSSKPMKKLQDDSDVYSVELFIDPVIIKKLEIYLKAEDVSGNSVFEGKEFTPLSYNVISNISSDMATVGVGSESKEEGMGTMTWILIGLGAALVAGGSGGSSSGGGGGGVSSETGTITITTDVPN